MSGNKYLELNTTTGRPKQRAATQVSAGAANAGDIIALGADGRLDSSVMPATGQESTEAVLATELLADGDWVNIYNNNGTRSCRKAIATDHTRPAHGFVTAGVTAGLMASISKRGTNAKVALTGLAAADLGSRMFLSPTTGGGCLKSCAAFSTGNLVQVLGSLTAINESYAEVDFNPGEQIIF
jgi:hypothetical protein